MKLILRKKSSFQEKLRSLVATLIRQISVSGAQKSMPGLREAYASSAVKEYIKQKWFCVFFIMMGTLEKRTWSNLILCCFGLLIVTSLNVKWQLSDLEKDFSMWTAVFKYLHVGIQP